MKHDPSTTTPPRRAPAAAAHRTVWVEAPARLHLGFLDPAGSLGRPFGSLGLSVSAPVTRLSLCAARGSAHSVTTAAGVPAEEAERAARHLAELQRRSGLDQPLALQLDEALAAHAGLGSGTQLALAVGRAFARWHALDLPTATLASWLGRGLRSGVGIAGFDRGGLLLDGGPLADGSPAPLLARLALPGVWRVLMVADPQCQGLSGSAERSALAALPPLPQAAAAAICHETLMRVLPGCAGAGFAAAAQGISRIQQILGDHFAPAQGGDAFVSPAVARLLRWIATAAAESSPGLAQEALGAGIGQSSWGPTGFALLPSAARAQQLLAAAQAAGVVDPRLTLRIAEPLNRGARILEHPPQPAARNDAAEAYAKVDAEADAPPPQRPTPRPPRAAAAGRPWPLR